MVFMVLPLAANNWISYGRRLKAWAEAIFWYAESERIKTPEPVSIIPYSGKGSCKVVPKATTSDALWSIRASPCYSIVVLDGLGIVPVGNVLLGPL